MPIPLSRTTRTAHVLVVAFLLRDLDRDLAALRAVLHGIRDEVADDPLDPGLVPVAEHARALGVELDRVARADLLVLGGEPANDLDEVRRADVELELVAHPQPGEVEQLVDQSDQLGGALVDDLEALRDLRSTRRDRPARARAGGGWRCP